MEAVARAFGEAIEGNHPDRVDLPLVTAGALLHDLGRARTHGIQHVRHGVDMAEERGLDPKVVEIIRRHVGGGLTAGEAEGMGLPPMDMMPRTLEERIVCHADTLVGARGRRTLEQTLEHISKKGSPEYVRRVKGLHRLLSDLAGEDLDAIGPWTPTGTGRPPRDTGATRFSRGI